MANPISSPKLNTVQFQKGWSNGFNCCLWETGQQSKKYPGKAGDIVLWSLTHRMFVVCK